MEEKAGSALSSGLKSRDGGFHKFVPFLTLTLFLYILGGSQVTPVIHV